jgi:hypothetical protein
MWLQLARKWAPNRRLSPEGPIARQSHDGGERRGFPEGPLISSFPARGGQIWVTSGMR